MNNSCYYKKKKNTPLASFTKVETRNCTTTLLWLLFIIIYMRINLCHPHLFCCSQHRGALHYMLMSPCRGWVKTVSSRELQTKKPELGLPQYCQCLMLWSSLGRMEVSVFCPNIVEFCDQNNAFNETVLWKIIFNSLPVVQEQHVFFFFFFASEGLPVNIMLEK